MKRISWRMDSGTISTRPYVFQLQRLTWYGRYCRRRWRWDVLRRKSTRERRVDLGFLIVAGSRRDVSRRIVYVLLTRGEMRKIVISLLSGHRIHLLASLSFPLASSLYSALTFLRFSSFLSLCDILVTSFVDDVGPVLRVSASMGFSSFSVHWTSGFLRFPQFLPVVSDDSADPEIDVQYFFLFHWVIELTSSFGSSSTWRRVF